MAGLLKKWSMAGSAVSPTILEGFLLLLSKLELKVSHGSRAGFILLIQNTPKSSVLTMQMDALSQKIFILTLISSNKQDKLGKPLAGLCRLAIIHVTLFIKITSWLKF